MSETKQTRRATTKAQKLKILSGNDLGGTQF
jgi:hypothetical protein